MNNLIKIFNKKLLIGIYLVVVVFLVLVSLIYYKYEKKRIIEEKYKDLHDITIIKTGQIIQWQNEKTEGIKINSQSPLLIMSIERFINNIEDSVSKKKLSEVLTLAKSRFNLERISLFSANGETILTIGTSDFSPNKIIIEKIDSTRFYNKITYTGFYFNTIENKLHFDIIAPIKVKNHIVALLLYCINLDNLLGNLISPRLSENSSTELQVICKKDTGAFYINYFQNQKQQRSSCYRIQQNDEIGVKACSGHNGSYIGKDIKGNIVLSDIHYIPEVNLIIITKINQAEVLSNLKYKIVIVTLIIIVFLVFLGIGLAYMFTNRQKNLYKELFIKEKNLREALVEFRTTLYSIGDAVICTDINGNIREMNRVAEMLTGWKESEAENKPLDLIFNILDENTRIPIRDIIEKVISNKNTEVLRTNSLLITCKGKEIPISKSVAAIIDEAGIFSGIVVVFRDQTEERAAQKAIKDSEEKYRLLFELSTEAIFLVDRFTGQYIDANASAERLTGRTIEELKGLQTKDVTPFGSKNRLVQLNSTEKSQEFGEVEYIRPDGTKRVALLSTVILGNNTVYGIARDITDRKNAENELIKAKEKAEESDRLKTAFLHNISHEIRTPMNAIFGFSSLLQSQGFDKEKTSHFTEIICQNILQLESIINDIICVATIEAGQEKIRKKEINLNVLLQNVFKQYELKANSRKLIFKLHTNLDDANSSIITDDVKLIQIISNLLNNAIKFTNKGEIQFGYIPKNDFLEFFVKDTGIGIPIEKHKIIFERFRQADSTIATNYGGTGLGLSISKSYIELLDGKIWVESEPTRGSTFYFTIPYQPANKSLSSQIHNKPSQDYYNLIQKTILIAEDEDINFILLNEVLKKFDCKVIRAKNGLEAVNICKNNDLIELVLMDIKMPEMDGFEATKQIKLFKSSLPIIAQTAYAHPSDKEKVKEYGCDDYIPKPISEDLLIKLLIKYLK